MRRGLSHRPSAAPSDEHVPYFVYAKGDQGDDHEEDAIAIAVTNVERFELAHAVTLAVIEKGLAKPDWYTKQILKNRRAFLSWYFPYADLRVLHVKRMEDADGLDPPTLRAKNWRGACLYRKLIKFNKNWAGRTSSSLTRRPLRATRQPAVQRRSCVRC